MCQLVAIRSSRQGLLSGSNLAIPTGTTRRSAGPTDLMHDTRQQRGSCVLPLAASCSSSSTSARDQLQHVLFKVCVLHTLQARAIGSSKAGHVKACYVMRGALELLDFDDASITDMKRMLLQVQASKYSRTDCYCAERILHWNAAASLLHLGWWDEAVSVRPSLHNPVDINCVARMPLTHTW